MIPVDFEIYGLLEQNVYQNQKITDFDSLKEEAIIEEWDKIPQEIIDKYIDAFKPRLRCVTEVEARHIEGYLLLIIPIDTSQYVFVKGGMILINQRKLL